MTRKPARVLPEHVPDLPIAELEPWLTQRSRVALMACERKGTGGWWKLALENRGGPARGLVVEVRGLPETLVEFGLATAAFNDGSAPFTSRRTRLKGGVRFTFDEVPLTRPKRARRLPAVKAASARGQLEQVLSAELGSLAARSSPEVTLVFRCLAAPPRKPVSFTVRAWPKAHPEGGFTMGAWFGHASLWWQFG